MATTEICALSLHEALPISVTLAAQLSVKVGVTGKLTALRHWLVKIRSTHISTPATLACTMSASLTTSKLAHTSSDTHVRITSACQGPPLATALCTFTIFLA